MTPHLDPAEPGVRWKALAAFEEPLRERDRNVHGVRPAWACGDHLNLATCSGLAIDQGQCHFSQELTTTNGGQDGHC
jgi:hypothetical protein